MAPFDFLQLRLLSTLLLLALPLLSSATPTPHPSPSASPASHFLTVTVVRLFGVPQQSHNLGPGYIPTATIGRDLRLAFSSSQGGKWDRECVRARGGDTGNGRLLGVGGECGGGWSGDGEQGKGEDETVFRWDMEGRIVHTEGRCLDLTEPEILLDAPDLGMVNLVQFWTCDGGANQQWVVLANTRKIASVLHPNLCLSPLGDEGILGAVECKTASDIGVTLRPQ